MDKYSKYRFFLRLKRNMLVHLHFVGGSLGTSLDGNAGGDPRGLGSISGLGSAEFPSGWQMLRTT